MGIDLNRAVIERVGVLSLLAEREMDELVSSVYELVFQAGDTIYEQNMEGKACYIIKRGVVRLARDNKITALYKRGDLFGEVAVLDDKTYEDSAIAVSETVLLAILKDDFRYFLDERPSVEMQIRNRILRRHAKNISRLFVHRTA